MSRSPVCYLDLDDTLIRRPPERPLGEAAPGASEFLRFLLEHFEVRWLTRWCPDGVMTEEGLGHLEGFFGIPPERLRGIRNRLPFPEDDTCARKSHGIDLEEARGGRPFVWLEERISDYDRERLKRHGLLSSFLECDVTRDPWRLLEVRRELVERFSLPDEEIPSSAA